MLKSQQSVEVVPDIHSFALYGLCPEMIGRVQWGCARLGRAIEKRSDILKAYRMDSTTQSNQNELQQELEKKISDIQSREAEERAQKLAQDNNLPYHNLALAAIDPAALTIVDEQTARASGLAIISKDGATLSIAILDPKNPATQQAITKLEAEGHICSVFIASAHSLQIAWDKYKIERQAKKKELGFVSISGSEISELKQSIKSVSDLKDHLKDMSTTQIVNLLIAGALRIDASDIHLEPQEQAIRLRYRIDGVLQDILDIEKKEYQQVLSRIKLLSGLKINVHQTGQDGRFTIKEEDTEIEVRTSILPGAYGENIVMRILDPRKIKQRIEELGMREDTLNLVKKLLNKTTGAIITTGPTGSGKTTSLYAFINQVNTTDIKIITIEDPIEYHITGISQTQVEPASGYTFANGLRSIVRQDPDVILVGEIRDPETADIAMQAALTGHLVFSTLHTNDAAGAIPRLIDFGIKPITIAPAVNAAMAQRLVRRLCKDCKKQQQISESDFAVIEKYLQKIPAEITLPPIEKSMQIYYPKKCEKCNFTGYKDRIGVYEVFAIDPEIEKLIITSPSITDIRSLAIQKGMLTMVQDGLIKVVQGITSVEEVLRVVGE